jgi:hypothetical protein
MASVHMLEQRVWVGGLIVHALCTERNPTSGAGITACAHIAVWWRAESVGVILHTQDNEGRQLSVQDSRHC